MVCTMKWKKLASLLLLGVALVGCGSQDRGGTSLGREPIVGPVSAARRTITGKVVPPEPVGRGASKQTIGGEVSWRPSLQGAFVERAAVKEDGTFVLRAPTGKGVLYFHWEGRELCAEVSGESGEDLAQDITPRSTVFLALREQGVYWTEEQLILLEERGELAPLLAAVADAYLAKRSFSTISETVQSEQAALQAVVQAEENACRHLEDWCITVTRMKSKGKDKTHSAQVVVRRGTQGPRQAERRLGGGTFDVQWPEGWRAISVEPVDRKVDGALRWSSHQSQASGQSRFAFYLGEPFGQENNVVLFDVALEPVTNGAGEDKHLIPTVVQQDLRGPLGRPLPPREGSVL